MRVVGRRPLLQRRDTVGTMHRLHHGTEEGIVQPACRKADVGGNGDVGRDGLRLLADRNDRIVTRRRIHQPAPKRGAGDARDAMSEELNVRTACTLGSGKGAVIIDVFSIDAAQGAARHEARCLDEAAHGLLKADDRPMQRDDRRRHGGSTDDPGKRHTTVLDRTGQHEGRDDVADQRRLARPPDQTDGIGTAFVIDCRDMIAGCHLTEPVERRQEDVGDLPSVVTMSDC